VRGRVIGRAVAARRLAPHPNLLLSERGEGTRRGGGLTGAGSAESAVDFMEASSFRSLAAVNGLRPPEAARA
jgi:hypothetical protein